MLQIVIDIQRGIYLALAEHIKAFAKGNRFPSCRDTMSLRGLVQA
jgi:hypothetical protein